VIFPFVQRLEVHLLFKLRNISYHSNRSGKRRAIVVACGHWLRASKKYEQVFSRAAKNTFARQADMLVSLVLIEFALTDFH
jgi:hypothetical protein